jgi:ABC-type xylose transport system permease subunit
MTNREPPLLDLTADGQFRRPARPPWAARVAGWALLVALLAGGLAGAAVAFWLALMLIPVAIIAGLVAYGAFRFHLWRNSR